MYMCTYFCIIFTFLYTLSLSLSPSHRYQHPPSPSRGRTCSSLLFSNFGEEKRKNNDIFACMR
jgi:hypothetical protein